MEGLVKMAARVPQAVLVKMENVEATEVPESMAGLVEMEAPAELVGQAHLAEMVETVVLEVAVRQVVMAAMVEQEATEEMEGTAVMVVTDKRPSSGLGGSMVQPDRCKKPGVSRLQYEG
ncbi:hypothetical protein [Pseudomonas sp. AM8]|uniref:hypothetical protein n=1 Tax=Pseudomonas sp. AM8 TaxID=2983368 RepID=UPI002E81B0E1|nr:hypothetical protein [Pseudomonas sp. AM8]